jgi:hypothetical protein
MADPIKSRRHRSARARVSLLGGSLEQMLDRPTLRRAGVFRRALRREVSRLRDRRRLLAMALLILTFGLVTAALLARGDLAGADARAYWAGVRIWLSGGDPYAPVGPFLPYIYAPWMLPLFAPWALLPWDVAWFVWRVGSVLLLLWTIEWAYRRRPLPTAILVVLLAFPIGASLDTGNINLFIVLAMWAAQFSGHRVAGFLWGLATWMKLAPVVFLPVLRPRARLWGLAFLTASVLLSVATLPLTIAQFQSLIGDPRPIRLDYLIFAWGFVPWLWHRSDLLSWARPTTWRHWLALGRNRLSDWTRLWRGNPGQGATAARREVTTRVRAFLDL